MVDSVTLKHCSIAQFNIAKVGIAFLMALIAFAATVLVWQKLQTINHAYCESRKCMLILKAGGADPWPS